MSDEPAGAPPPAGEPQEDEKARARREALERAETARAAAEAEKPPWERSPEPPEWVEVEDLFVDDLRARHGEALLSARRFAGDLVLEIDRRAVRDVARTLQDEEGFRLLLDICGADYPDREPRFDVVYHLRDIERGRILRLRVQVGEGEEVPSLTPVFRGAGWPEREVWDMYGIRFADHPDLTRILMWEGFEGHPLRKDFPVEGISTGSAAYPELYEEGAGPVSKAGTGWLAPDDEEDE
ncbi:MAG: NADH-quinone oxidoreductase subunit C [Thermoanaerobaculia bacterium]